MSFRSHLAGLISKQFLSHQQLPPALQALSTTPRKALEDHARLYSILKTIRDHIPLHDGIRRVLVRVLTESGSKEGESHVDSQTRVLFSRQNGGCLSRVVYLPWRYR